MNPNCSYATAKKYYEDYLVYDMLMAQGEARMEELSTIIKIFEKHPDNSAIGQTTTILPILVVQKKNIEENRATIKLNRQNNDIAKNLLRSYFQRNSYLLPDVSKEIFATKAKLEKSFKDTMLSRCKDKQYDKVIEPNKKPDGDDAPRRYEKSPKHPDYKTVADIEKFLAKGISPSPQNGQAMLDISVWLGIGVRGTIENGYVVLFHRHRCLPEGGSLYHGFLESIDLFKRRDDYREIFIKNNIINRSGKIL